MSRPFNHLDPSLTPLYELPDEMSQEIMSYTGPSTIGTWPDPQANEAYRCQASKSFAVEHPMFCYETLTRSCENWDTLVWKSWDGPQQVVGMITHKPTYTGDQFKYLASENRSERILYIPLGFNALRVPHPSTGHYYCTKNLDVHFSSR